uniref:Uncharacterized protein n=1 Tax=Lepeophtheirus salmonis TaxID=72036 RepID=A0A0K2TP77_LEPSM
MSVLVKTDPLDKLRPGLGWLLYEFISIPFLYPIYTRFKC